MMRKYLLLLITLLLLSFHSNAQFKKLIQRAKEKAVEAVLGDDTDSSQNTNTTSSQSQGVTNPESTPATDEETSENPSADTRETPKIKKINFPVTGDTIHALQGLFEPVIDGAVKKIKQTPQGAYGFKLARQKGLAGTDVEVFQQMMETKNREIMEEIEEAVEAKFPHSQPEPEPESENPFVHQKKDNPAWGGISAPSLYFYAMVGGFNVWISNRYLKTSMRHDHPTMADMFGVTAAGITDMLDRKIYAIGSVLGVNFTTVQPLDTGRYHGIYRAYGLIKKEYLGIQGVEIEAGEVGMYGKYHTVSEKITIPVQPYTEPESSQKSDYLLLLHDMLSGKEDAAQEIPHYDPDYKIIFEAYYTHDLDAILPKKFKTRDATGITGTEGICIGVKIRDENGNSANYRLINLHEAPIDKGAFKVPDDYPVMTQDELNEAIKKQFSLKNLFKKALKNGTSDGDN